MRVVAPTTGVALLLVLLGATTHPNQHQSSLLSLQQVAQIPIVGATADSTPADSALGSVSWASVTTTNQAVVLDGRSGQLTVLEHTGRFRSQFVVDGLRGTSACGALAGGAVVGDSVVAVWNAREGRVVVTQLDGRELRRFRIPLRGYTVGSGNAVAQAEGNTIALRTTVGAPPGQEYWIRYRLDGTVVDSVASNRPRAQWRTPEGMRMPYTSTRLTFPCVSTGSLTLNARAGAVVGPGDRPVFTIDSLHRPISVSAGERTSWASLLDGDDRAREITIPDSKPIARSAFCDQLGRIWIELHQAELRDATPAPSTNARRRTAPREIARYEVRDVRGASLGEVQLPTGFELLTVGTDIIWALRTEPAALVAFRVSWR